MTDMLDRLFGPDPEQGKFPPLNPAKIIPFHDCQYVELRTWGWNGVFLTERCAVCNEPRPQTREEP